MSYDRNGIVQCECKLCTGARDKAMRKNRPVRSEEALARLTNQCSQMPFMATAIYETIISAGLVLLTVEEVDRLGKGEKVQEIPYSPVHNGSS